MATAKRLYLYIVSATGLGMALFGAIAMLHILLNFVGVGAQASAGSVLKSNADRDLVSLAIAVGVVGLVLWLTHWAATERMVSGPGQQAAAERASIVRSVYLALVMAATLIAAATLAIQLAGDSLANGLNARQSYSYQLVDDSWALAAIILFTAVWAHNAWIRRRDLRQGTAITGAAAWVSRLYLYGAAFVGVFGVLFALSSVITTVASEILRTTDNPLGFDSSIYASLDEPSTPVWVRPIVAALVGLVIWGGVWLSHWLYSNRLRAGDGDQASAERTSRVRLAFLMMVVLWGAAMFASGLSQGLGMLFAVVLGSDLHLTPLWYVVIVPPVSALPAAAAWLLHRQRALAESPQGPLGVSARRIAGYLMAWIGIGLIVNGAEQALATAFDKWLPGPAASSYSSIGDTWKLLIGVSVGALVTGLIFWVWPWLSAQRRRAQEWTIEANSSARSYYLYAVTGSLILAAAVGFAMVAYRYLRIAFGLNETGLKTEISTPLALLLVSVVALAYHAFVLRGDMKGPRQPRYAEPAYPVASTDWVAPVSPAAVPVDSPAPPVDPAPPTL